MHQPIRILYVDDYPLDRDLVRHALKKETDFLLIEASSRKEFEKCLTQGSYDVVLSDFNILGFEGLEVIKAIRVKDPSIPVVIVTGTGSEEVAVEAMKQGAADYVIKTPRHIAKLPLTIRAAIETKRLESENESARRACLETEERLSLALKGADLAWWDWNIKSGSLHFNERFSEMLGYFHDELERRIEAWVNLIHPDDAPNVKENWRAHLKGITTSFEAEYRLSKKSGEWLWVLDRGKIVERDATGKALRGLGTILDITERKKLEEDRNRLFNLSIDMLCVAGFDGYFKQVNPAFTKTLGWTATELMTQPWLEFVHPDDYQETIAAGNSLISGDSVIAFRNRYKCKDGSFRLMSWNAFPLPEQKLIFAVVRDLTGEVNLERQLVQAQKMEAIGTLAGGIAHDFNNILTIILGYAELALAKKSPDSADYSEFQTIKDTAQRGADLVKRIMTLSRKGQSNPKPIDLNRCVEESSKLLSNTIPKMINIELYLADQLKTINADPGQIEQVLLNLAVNSHHAMPEGGSLVIETNNVTLDEYYTKINPDVTPTDYVMLSVSDTGQGMSPEIVERIFEPFFTTKKAGEGTGLGLSMVFGIVKNHGGHIKCYSEPGVGTSIKIYFPVIDAEKESETKTKDLGYVFGNETILLVDDEILIRRMTEQMLTRGGYTVLTANNGREAIDLYNRMGERIALVILDLIMPEMGGKACLEHLLKINPDVKVIIGSGLTPDRNTKLILDASAKGFVSKPYNFTEFLTEIRHVLDAP